MSVAITLKELAGMSFRSETEKDCQPCEICHQKHDLLELEGFFFRYSAPEFGSRKNKVIFDVAFRGSIVFCYRSTARFVMVQGYRETVSQFEQRQQTRISLITKANAEDRPLHVKYRGPCNENGQFMAYYDEGPSSGEIDDSAFAPQYTKEVSEMKKIVRQLTAQIKDLETSWPRDDPRLDYLYHLRRYYHDGAYEFEKEQRRNAQQVKKPESEDNQQKGSRSR